LDLFSDSFSNFIKNDSIFSDRSEQIFLKNSFSNIFYDNSLKTDSSNILFHYSDYNETLRLSRKSQGTVSPCRLIKYPVSNKTNFNFNSDVIELFRFRFNEYESSSKQRTAPHSTFLIIRQKRYKRRKTVLPRTIFYKDKEGNPTKEIKYSQYTFLSQNKIILQNLDNPTKQYKFFRKNKNRYELGNLVLSKRMLRTRRTLVLPAHVNITAITNSYDVVHS